MAAEEINPEMLIYICGRLEAIERALHQVLVEDPIVPLRIRLASIGFPAKNVLPDQYVTYERGYREAYRRIVDDAAD